MKKNPKICNSISRETAIAGWSYYAFELIFLPSILLSLGRALRLSDAVVNFVYYLLNFAFVVLIFRDFLSRSLGHAGKHLAAFLLAVSLGVIGCRGADVAMSFLVRQFAADFANVNDTAVISMVASSPVLMAIGTILLVPTAEECLFRGLIFSQLRPKHRAAAYSISVAAFCAVHVVGFVGAYPAETLAVCFMQYIPAGLILAWSYERSGTIVAPILVHSAVNSIAFLQAM